MKNEHIGGCHMERIKNLWFDNNRIYMRTTDGQIMSRPLEAYPELEEASSEQRNDYTITDDGMAIRWESIDADMHITSFYETTEPNSNNEVAIMFSRLPWLNTSEVAQVMGMHGSLLSRYIHGITKPTQERIDQIRSTLHKLAGELQTV